MSVYSKHTHLVDWYRDNYLSVPKGILRYPTYERWETGWFIIEYDLLPNGKKNVSPLVKKKLRKIVML